MYQNLKLRVTGVSPLLCHNGSLADPMNPTVKEMKKITSKRGKTEADLEELARLEWLGGLYIENGKLVIPSMNIEATFVEGAKKTRMGKQALAGAFCQENPVIIYDGPTDLKELWRDENFRLTVGAKVQRARIMRTRPMFKQWALEFVFTFNDEVLNESTVLEIFKTAGELVGFGDWRPKFGRFTVTVVE